MKKVIFFVFSIFASAYLSALPDVLNKKQASIYIDQVIDNLFDLDNELLNNDMINFKKNTKNILLNKLAFYPHSYAAAHMYNKKDIKKGIFSEVLFFIEQKTKKYARIKLESMHLDHKVDNQKIIVKVLEDIRNKVSVNLSDFRSNQNGIMSDFIGSNLKERVNNIINQEIKFSNKHTPMPANNLYYPSSNSQGNNYLQQDIPIVQSRAPIVTQTPEYVIDYVPGYMVEVADVYEPVYQPIAIDYPGFSMGAGINLGRIFGNSCGGFLDFQLNL